MPEYLVRFNVNASKQIDDPKVAYEAVKATFAAADEMMKAGILKHFWGTGVATGVLIVELPSFEEAYKLGNRFFPGMSMDIQGLVPYDKVKEITLGLAKEAAKK
jgi:hypothetical protein